MNTGKRSTAITEAIATPQSFSTTHQSIRPLKVTSQQEKYLYFNLGIYTLEDFDQVDELQAGNSYQLVISCDEKPCDNRSTFETGWKTCCRRVLPHSFISI